MLLLKKIHFQEEPLSLVKITGQKKTAFRRGFVLLALSTRGYIPPHHLWPVRLRRSNKDVGLRFIFKLPYP
jgi:hypothetical protein